MKGKVTRVHDIGSYKLVYIKDFDKPLALSPFEKIEIGDIIEFSYKTKGKWVFPKELKIIRSEKLVREVKCEVCGNILITTEEVELYIKKKKRWRKSGKKRVIYECRVCGNVKLA